LQGRFLGNKNDICNSGPIRRIGLADAISENKLQEGHKNKKGNDNNAS